jgi:TolA-binding protein
VFDYPENRKMPDALLKLGSAQLHLNENVKGKETLQRLMEKYPGSAAAARAREQLVGP